MEMVTATLKARGVVEISARIDDDNGNPHYETITIQVRQTPSVATQHAEQAATQTAPATYTVVVEKPYLHPAIYVAIAVAVVLAVLALYIAAKRR